MSPARSELPMLLDLLLAADRNGYDEFDILLNSISQDDSRLLHVCAIPHYITRSVLRVIVDGHALDLEGIWRTINSYSVTEPTPPVNGTEPTVALTHKLRDRLFSKWLDEPGSEFRDVSTRLVHYWSNLSGDSIYAAARFDRERLFHELGVDLHVGFEKVRATCDELLSAGRPGEVASMVRYALEYKRVLTAAEVLRLTLLGGAASAATGDLADARYQFEAVIKATQADANLRSEALLGLARIEAQAGHISRAEALYREIISIARREPDSGIAEIISNSMLELGIILHRSAQGSEARALLEEAATQNFPGTAARARLELGLIMRAANQLEGAADQFRKGLSDVVRLGIPTFVEAELRRELAAALEHLSLFGAAVEELETSLAISRQLGDTMGAARALSDAARLSLRRNEAHRSVRLANEASEAFNAVSATVHAGVARLQAGHALAELKDTAGARDAYRKAERLFESSGAATLGRIASEEIRSLRRTRSLISWILGVGGLSGLASVIMVMEVEHLYFSLASIVFVFGMIASNLWWALNWIWSDLMSLASPTIAATIQIALIAPLLFFLAFKNENNRHLHRFREFVVLFAGNSDAISADTQSLGRELKVRNSWLTQGGAILAALTFLLVSVLGLDFVRNATGSMLGLLLDQALGPQPSALHVNVAFPSIQAAFAGAYTGIIVRGLRLLRYGSVESNTYFYHSTSELIVWLVVGGMTGFLNISDQTVALGVSGVVAVAAFCVTSASPSSIRSTARKMTDLLRPRTNAKSARPELADLRWLTLDAVSGLTATARDHLRSLHIEDITTLASANPIQLFIETPFQLYPILDWVGQAQLLEAVGLHITAALRSEGIRTMADLVRAYKRPDPHHGSALEEVRHALPSIEQNLTVSRYLRLVENVEAKGKLGAKSPADIQYEATQMVAR